MSSQAYGDLDPAETLGLWVVVPEIDASDRSGSASWAEPVADWVAETRGLDATDLPRIASFLDTLARQSRPSEASWRLAFLLDPDLGAAVWDIAFLEPDERLSARALVRADEDDQLGSEVTEFAWNNRSGLQSVRYGLADRTPVASDRRAGETEIMAHASVTVTRELPGMGDIALLAFTATGHLDSLSLSLVPMQYLLTSDWFAELVGSTF